LTVEVSRWKGGEWSFTAFHIDPSCFWTWVLLLVTGQEFLQRQKQDPEIADVSGVITAMPERLRQKATAILSRLLELPGSKFMLSTFQDLKRFPLTARSARLLPGLQMPVCSLKFGGHGVWLPLQSGSNSAIQSAECLCARFCWELPIELSNIYPLHTRENP